MSDPLSQTNVTLAETKFLEAPFLKLAETVKDFADLYTKPKMVINLAKAEVEVDRIKALGKLDNEELLAQKIKERIYKREIGRQIAIDEIAQEAENYLPPNVSDEPVKEGWKNSYVDGVQDSEKDMRTWWAKILAGEVGQPGSYSLRTLDLSRKISKEEAEIFTKVAEARVSYPGLVFILSAEHNDNFLNKNFGILLSDIVKLQDIGLISPNVLTLNFDNSEHNQTLIFSYAKKFILIKRKDDTPKQTIFINLFTQVGYELFSIVEPKPANIEYIKALAKPFYYEGVELKFAEIPYNSERPLFEGDMQNIEFSL